MMQKLKNLNITSCEQHPFHLVDPSPWPIMVSLSIFLLTLSTVCCFHYTESASELFMGSFLALVFFLIRWFADIIDEATYEGHHTDKVQQGIRLGMSLFIVSEVMFFVSFFWAFFHCTISPNINLGTVWPPQPDVALDPWGLPLLNTFILLTSGVTITYAHKAIIAGHKILADDYLYATIFYGVIFTFVQGYEYTTAPFSINDSVFGSLFFMLTGFHGIHVIIGTIFLIICYFRLHYGHFTTKNHIGFECAALYWHFVDVVWLFLFAAVYIWGC